MIFQGPTNLFARLLCSCQGHPDYKVTQFWLQGHTFWLQGYSVLVTRSPYFGYKVTYFWLKCHPIPVTRLLSSGYKVTLFWLQGYSVLVTR